MREWKAIMVAGLAFAAVAWIAPITWAKKCPLPKVEFSADSTMRIGEHVVKGKWFHGKHKQRREQSMGGMQTVVIADRKGKQVTVLMPAMKGYFRRTLSEKENPLASDDCDLEAVGAATVNGLKTVKHRFKAKGGFQGFAWITKDHIPVRFEGKAVAQKGQAPVKMTMELSNVKIGSQPSHLFAVPKGYRQMNVPGLGKAGPGPGIPKPPSAPSKPPPSP